MPLEIHLPICSFDARAGLLCTVCEAKAKSGLITEADIDVSKALIQVAGRSREMESLTLVKSHRVDHDYLLEVQDAGASALRKPAVKDELERALGGRIWVTTASSSNRQLVEDLVHPLRVSTLSTLWLPDGSKVSKAVIESGGGGRRSGKKLETIQKLAKVARGIDLLVAESQERHPYRRDVWNSSDSRTHPSWLRSGVNDEEGHIEIESTVGVAR